MDPKELLARVAGLLWGLADRSAASVADTVDALPELAGETEPALRGKLLEPLADLPRRESLLKLAHDLLGNPTDAGAPVRAHGWQRAQGARRGIAFVLAKNGARAVLAVSPGPVVDLVVTPNAALDHTVLGQELDLRLDVRTTGAWTASFAPGATAVAPNGEAHITVGKKQLTAGSGGPGVSTGRVEAVMEVSTTVAAHVDITIHEFQARLLPAALAGFLGRSTGAATTPTDLTITLSRDKGLRFAEGAARVEKKVNLELPGISLRGFAVELGMRGDRFELTPTVSLLAKPPALPLSADLDGLGVGVPMLLPDRFGAGTDVLPTLPSGMGIALLLGPVSGGGFFQQRPGDAYAGGIDVNLGVVQVKAFGLLQLPSGGKPLSLLVLMGAEFPYPGIQLGFGFAIDAVGGLVGIHRRADTDRLRELVSGGNVDRVLFPGNAIARSDEIVGALEGVFPVARGRFLVGPMLRITWGGRLFSVAVAVIMELPGPGRTLILGRALIALPDPAVPLIRLQGSVLGRIAPGVPVVEFTVSLAGSWIVGMPVTGEVYALFRGGDQSAFVLSAGGFHPKYTRPPGVPPLQRLSMDIGGGVLGLRAESYLALTSNSVQFGAELHLDATVAECGLEGWLGVDALFVWEPVLTFSAHVYAGVAVLAFGERLAGIGLDFTLEGPAPWHAFGRGSIEVLFWDVSLDFDVRWGDPAPPVRSTENIPELLRTAVARRDAWTVVRPASERAGIRFTDRAKQELAQGVVAHADSALRITQSVVPLDKPFNRFHRLTVPDQTWRIAAVRFGTTDAPKRKPVPERFVPGEYFAMTNDEQLTRPAFEELIGGFELSDTEPEPGGAHLVDDRYETGYEVEAGWFPSPLGNIRIPLRLLASFPAELFARPIRPAERVDRWRLAQRAMGNRAPKVVMKR
ncbi:DUF6603 domain-containing protein [Nocardia pneumoniae]|uniref:DUF6603 domain-containing protein n=1 Tax=Nocardia pneumoniae TaxID=228601 RepID=UPI0002DC5C67|nr:DUF6603 domain-containing protein [Nocardia pneumoniae]